MHSKFLRVFVAASVFCFFDTVAVRAAAPPPDIGYVIHFDCFSNLKEARRMIEVALEAGATVVNLVPPAHIWERADALALLDDLIEQCHQHKLKFFLTRIDASYPPDQKGARYNYLYGQILTTPGRLPDGSATVEFFLATAGRDDYAQWMEEETRFYARRYGTTPGLLGINLGPFSEPFVSQRGGFLQYTTVTETYEITQYTPAMEIWWARWLEQHFHSIDALNAAYQAQFQKFDSVPLPRNEQDPRFGHAPSAYLDFVRSINDWFVERYERCRKIWHEEGGRADIPFILQFSGFDAEKIKLGRPAYAAFDRRDWIRRADAIGLSIYTNEDYPDFGHGSVTATVAFIAKVRDPQKPVFVLEGGCETRSSKPNLTELTFFADAARPLHPRSYVYEFLKTPFYSVPLINDEGLMTVDGEIRRPMFEAVKKTMKEIR